MSDEAVTSLDIDITPEPTAPGALAGRRAFRVPVLELEDYTVEHGGEVYPIVDISSDGAGVSLHVPMSLSSNELVEDCALCLASLRISDLEGRVVHCSAVLEGACWLIGVHWLNLEQSAASAISEHLRPHRDALFEADS